MRSIFAERKKERTCFSGRGVRKWKWLEFSTRERRKKREKGERREKKENEFEEE